MFIRSRLGRLIMWMALAAGAMYFFDPVSGEQRRRDLRKRFEKMRSAGEESMGSATEPRRLDTGV
jgi:hypothetical protein